MSPLALWNSFQKESAVTFTSVLHLKGKLHAAVVFGVDYTVLLFIYYLPGLGVNIYVPVFLFFIFIFSLYLLEVWLVVYFSVLFK